MVVLGQCDDPVTEALLGTGAPAQDRGQVSTEDLQLGLSMRRVASDLGVATMSVYRHVPGKDELLILTRPQPAPNGLRFVEWVLDALSGTRLSRHERLYVHIMLVSFVRGVASALEPEAAAVRETGLSAGEWLETQESPVETLTLPHLRELADADTFDLDLDFLVRFGLARLLDGLDLYVDGLG
ncbi:TetR/AcrR family transcriptional regulator C-terminal domain-containing protein [Actinoplanes friuliensis]|uniref:Fatty acid metabolism regulator protein n=1 Tax=Actinoplanes friuliensis DSM 7358 TaxID=1246995 RepID=U5WA43_9ACTN|nr:TetR/AcrR family transcriptional regulator C-terminal domain-containing protein [Actinoplanes friuliensis]AGZ44855.1 Fatty acid metabolism regulator protein [Actinoplanes friuliensis DSM 7358]